MTSGNISALKAVLMAVVIGICITGALQAQEISKYDLEERAGHYFEQEQYEKAQADYEVLYNMYPKDARYAYYLGRCYLHSNSYLDRACELLKFSATRNFGDDSYFYLGLAYHLNYSFEDAALSFMTFRKTASSRTLKKFDVDYYLAQTRSAREAVEVAQHLEVENMQVVPAHAVETAFKNDIGGKYIYVPDEFRTSEDRNEDYSTLMFLPNSVQVGDYIYFSCLSKNSKNGSDIYWAKRVTDQDYSLPEPLTEVINTPYDEAWPYYDKENATLYFSSKGHNSIGGYDIYKAKYDVIQGKWLTPERLAFPINSVRDDFLYTPTKTKDEAVFATNRGSGMNEYEAFTIEIVEPGDYISPANREDVLALAMLSPSSITIKDPILAKIDRELDGTREYTDDNAVIEDDGGSYATLIEEALELQAHSDSLESIAEGLRIKSRDENNFKKKQEMVATITTLDKESKLLQNQADAKFKAADDLRQADRTPLLAENTTTSENPENSNTPTGITLYTYDIPPASSAPGKKQPVQDQETYNKGYAAAAAMGEELASSFSIMNSSPYSTNNPIPMASIPGGLVYRIQLGAFTQDIPDDTFGGLTPVSKENTARATKYYVGIFPSIKDARDALEKVKAYGYPDAFLVSFYNKNKISVQKAREIEFGDR